MDIGERSAQAINKVIQRGHWRTVKGGDQIQPPKIHTDPHTADVTHTRIHIIDLLSRVLHRRFRASLKRLNKHYVRPHQSGISHPTNPISQTHQHSYRVHIGSSLHFHSFCEGGEPAISGGRRTALCHSHVQSGGIYHGMFLGTRFFCAKRVSTPVP